ncbi:MAG: hypothetical protein WA793_04865 [Sphingorhabdus sp.]|uniref:hypothetical protein n=1 Tax=Sphingorhabdus sp. TaxID=1902408 RepID=UPI003C92B6C2
MTRRIDSVAYGQAIREWVLPPCLHVPVAARDQKSITNHIGEIVQVVSPGKALLVRVDAPQPPDHRFPIFEHPNLPRLFEPLQLWVHPRYTRYRAAWVRTFGPTQIEDRVLHHVYNRRKAVLIGFDFVRLAPISRQTNSSSAATERWGVELCTPGYIERHNRRGLRMRYGDLGDLMTLLDIPLGGGVQEMFRLGQNLVEVPGLRPPQE